MIIESHQAPFYPALFSYFINIIILITSQSCLYCKCWLLLPCVEVWSSSLWTPRPLSTRPRHKPTLLRPSPISLQSTTSRLSFRWASYSHLSLNFSATRSSSVAPLSTYKTSLPSFTWHPGPITTLGPITAFSSIYAVWSTNTLPIMFLPLASNSGLCFR